jgi:DNA-binding MarR family transcriptional regulator
MKQSGYIYVLANPSTSGIVKIGKTQQDPVKRAKELSSASGVPAPFIVVYHAYFDDYVQAERFVHSRLENSRVSNNREFFRVEIPVAINAVVDAKRNFGGFEDVSNLIEDHNGNQSTDPDTITFGNIHGPERGLYELLDMLMNHSMHGWNDFVKSMGLSMPQFSILMQVYYRGAFSISDIGNRFGVSVPAASQLVEKLVKAGYLERAEDPKDRRARLLLLSTKGKKLIEHGFKIRYHWMDELVDELTIEEKEKVIKALKLLTETTKGKKI